MEEVTGERKTMLYLLSAAGLLIVFLAGLIIFSSNGSIESSAGSITSNAEPDGAGISTSNSANPNANADEFDQNDQTEAVAVKSYDDMRNRQEEFSRFSDIPVDDLDINALTDQTSAFDNGPSSLGQFRLACQYSHFAEDDPILLPGQPGQSHLHMFFGNTETDAFTTERSLLDSGGGTCQGFELNRSAYWTPALLDGRGNAIIPDSIIIYYKTRKTDEVISMPQGLQMIAGNSTQESFEASQKMLWSCGASGFQYNETNTIPECDGDVINAAVQFPNCWDGKNLEIGESQSHLIYVDDAEDCPASHPEALPQITILIYFPGTDSIEGWHLASDRTDGFNGPPGGSLHADWWGGWNNEAIDLWTEGCLRKSRNCSGGQTGTDRQLVRVSELNNYEGENFLPLPK